MAPEGAVSARFPAGSPASAQTSPPGPFPVSPNGTPLRALIEAYKCQDIVTIATSNIIVASGETESAHHPLPVLLQPYPSSLALTAAGMLPQLGIVQVERLEALQLSEPFG